MVISRIQSTILMVDDDEGHSELVRRSLRRGGVTDTIVALNNGSAALDYLFFRGPHADRPRDADLLVLLDINMPGIDGFEVLRQIKSYPGTRSIPVLMLTTADNPREMARCREYGCNRYVTKSLEPTTLIAAIRRLRADVEAAPRDECLRRCNG